MSKRNHFRTHPVQNGTLRFERLEDRVLLAGDVSVSLGTLPAGKELTVEYLVDVDNPFPKGLDHVFNQATVSGTSITSTVTDPVITNIDLAPQVTAVFVNGTAWNPAFRTELANLGLGDATFGYAIPDGANQLDVLPWVNIDQVSIQFSEDVDIQSADLTLQSIDPVAISSFAYDLTTFTATWTLTASVGNNKIRAVLDGTSAGAVTDAALNQMMDGEWNELGTAVFNSGDGVTGGDFNFRFNVQPGDVTGEGNTTVTDLVNISALVGSSPPGPLYSVFFDVNGSADITVTDLVNTSAYVGTTQPAGEPAGPPASGWQPDATPPPDPPAGTLGDLDVTKTANLFIDVDGDGQADPGDQIRYTVVIQNNTANDVLNVQLDDCFHPNLTLVAGSINVSPLALDDSYSSIGNTLLEVNAGGTFGADPSVKITGSLFDNDTEFLGDTFSLFSFDGTSAQGATVAVATDGSFTYQAVAGVTGLVDTFTYSIFDGSLLGMATVSVDLTELVWFVDDSAGAGGDGTSSNPFNSFGPVNGAGGVGDVDGVDDTIYVRTGSGTITAGLELESGQSLIGEGVALVVNAITLQSAGTRPLLVNGAGNAVSLAADNAISGLNIGNTAGTGIIGSNFGTLTINDVAISGGGAGIDVTNGTLAVTLDSLTSTSGSLGIDLDTTGGNFTVTGATTINATAGTAIRVASSPGLTANFDMTSLGAVNTVDQGVSLSSSAGATFTFASIEVATDSGGTGLFASNAGTINITDGAINGGTGSAVDIDNTNLGISLTRVHSDGGTATGIDLQNTTGSFSITGVGSLTGTGGNISNKTGTGIFLSSANNISLANMLLSDFTDFAIRGVNVNNFTLTDSTINGTNGNSTAADEGSVSFDNLTGNAIFEGSQIEGGLEDNIVITNTSGTLNMFVRDTASDQMIIGLNSFASGNDGILIETQSNAVLNLDVRDTEFLGARGDMLQVNALGTSTVDIVLIDNSFNNTHGNIISGGGGITISGGSASSNPTVTYDISGTTAGDQVFSGALGSAITVNFVNGQGNISGEIRNNHIGISGTAGSGSISGSGISIGATTVNLAATMTHSVTIDNNTILGIDGFAGIDVLANTNATVDVQISNNVIDQFGGFALAGIYTIVGGASASDTAHICADIFSNTIDASASFGFDTFIDQISLLASYNFPGYGGPATPGLSPNALDAFLAAQNTLVGGLQDSSLTTNVSGSGTDCGTPPEGGPPGLRPFTPPKTPGRPPGGGWLVGPGVDPPQRGATQWADQLFENWPVADRVPTSSGVMDRSVSVEALDDRVPLAAQADTRIAGIQVKPQESVEVARGASERLNDGPTKDLNVVALLGLDSTFSDEFWQ